jgi:hypothetical protein
MSSCPPASTAPSLRPVLLLWTLGAALLAVQPLAGLLLLAASVIKYPESCREAGRKVQTSDSLGTYGLAMGLFVFAVQWLMQPPAPSDDLLRHIPAYAYDYLPRAIYPHAAIPAFSLYPAFEHALGLLAPHWSAFAIAQFVLALAWATAIALALALARRAGVGLGAGTSLLVCLLFSSALAERLFLGRPEVFAALWGVSALLCGGPRALAAWVLGGALLSSSYWLFPLYLPFVLLLPLGWRARSTAALVLGAYHLGFWTWHAGSLGAYVDALRLIPAWTKGRLMPVLETGSIWQAFARPPLLLLTLLGLTGLSRLERRARIALCVVGAAVLLTNMVRYAAVLALLGFVAALPLVPALNAFARKHLAAAFLALMLPMLTVGVARQAAPTFGELPRFTLPAGAQVLTAFNSATYAVPFFNPGKVQVIPAMELGAEDLPYQKAVQALNHGRLTCEQLQPLTITHVVEHSQTSMPGCLRLVAVQGDWRLWEVSNGR